MSSLIREAKHMDGNSRHMEPTHQELAQHLKEVVMIAMVKRPRLH